MLLSQLVPPSPEDLLMVVLTNKIASLSEYEKQGSVPSATLISIVSFIIKNIHNTELGKESLTAQKTCKLLLAEGMQQQEGNQEVKFPRLNHLTG